MRQRSSVNDGSDDRMWPGTVMALGVVFGLAGFWFLGTRTLITFGVLLRWFALFAFAGNLMPYRVGPLRWGMERLEWFLFNLFAVGPVLFTCFLCVNFFFRGEEQLYVVPNALKVDPHMYWIQSGELPHHVPYAEYTTGARSFDEIKPGDAILGIARGAIGYPVITQWKALQLESWSVPLQVEILPQLEGEPLADQTGPSGHRSGGLQLHVPRKGAGEKHHEQ
jgi:hypothetical protein